MRVYLHSMGHTHICFSLIAAGFLCKEERSSPFIQEQVTHKRRGAQSHPAESQSKTKPTFRVVAASAVHPKCPDGPSSESLQTIEAGEGVGKGTSSNVSVNVNDGTQHGGSLKPKMELPRDPAIPLLDIHLSREHCNLKRYVHPNIHRSTICSSQRHGNKLNVHW